MVRFTRYAAVACAAFLAMSASAVQAQKLENQYNDWNVFTIKQSGKTVCYMASAPVKQTGTYKSRGEPYMLVTHRSSNVDEVSLSSGYPYKEKGEVVAVIDGKATHKLFTKEDLAWAYTEKADAALVSGMRKGSKMTVKGHSRLGTHSLDTYSLRGFSKAYDRMKALCR